MRPALAALLFLSACSSDDPADDTSSGTEAAVGATTGSGGDATGGDSGDGGGTTAAATTSSSAATGSTSASTADASSSASTGAGGAGGEGGSGEGAGPACAQCEGHINVVCDPECGPNCNEVVCTAGDTGVAPMLQPGSSLLWVPAVSEQAAGCADVCGGARPTAWAIRLRLPVQASSCLSVVAPPGYVAQRVLENSSEPAACVGEAAQACSYGGHGDPGDEEAFLVVGVPAGQTSEGGAVRIKLAGDESCTNHAAPDCDAIGCVD